MSPLLLAAALAVSVAACARPEVARPAAELSDGEIRALICRGPTDRIPDDDPGLDLIRDREPDSLEARKVALAIERENNCGERERLSAIAAAVEHICMGEPDGKSCKLLRDATEPISAVTYQERAEVAERIICPNGVNDWDETAGPRCD